MRKNNFKPGLLTLEKVPNDLQTPQNPGINEEEHLSLSPNAHSTHISTREKIDESCLSNIESLIDPKENLRSILKDEQRSIKDLWTLYEILKDLKFFRNFLSADEKQKQDVLLPICKKIGYESFNAGNVIIRQSEHSNCKVYIILSGEVNVFIANHNYREGSKTHSTSLPKETLQKQSERSIQTPNLKASVYAVLATIKCRRGSKMASNKDINPSIAQVPSILSIPKDSVDLSSQQNLQNVSSLVKKLKSKSRVDTNDKSPFRDYGSIVCKLREGDFFGERALYKAQKRSATIVANTDVELLVIDRDTFKAIHGEFDKAKADLIEFLRVSIPNINQTNTTYVLENLFYIADVREYQYHKTLNVAGNIGEEFYLILEGQCEIMKTVIYDNSELVSGSIYEVKALYGLKKTKKEDIVISNVEKGSFVSEEICFDDQGICEYTIRVSSDKAKIVCFNKQNFLRRCPKIILKALQHMFKTKKERNKVALFDKLQRRGVVINQEALEEIKPIIPSPRASLLLRSDIYQSPPISARTDRSELPPSAITNFDPMSFTKSELQKEMLSSRYFPSHETQSEDTNSTVFLARMMRYNSDRSLVKPKIDAKDHIHLTSRSPLSSYQTSASRNGSIGPKISIIVENPGSPKVKKSFVVGNDFKSNFVHYLGKLSSKYDRTKNNEHKQDGFVNNISNFKIGFDEINKDLERKSNAKKTQNLKIVTGVSKPSKFVPTINLADLITMKLKEGNIGQEVLLDERLSISPRVDECRLVETPNDLVKNKSPNSSALATTLRNSWTDSKSSMRLTSVLSSPRVKIGVSKSSPKDRDSEGEILLQNNKKKSIINIGQEVPQEITRKHIKSKSQVTTPKEVINIHVVHSQASSPKRALVFKRPKVKTTTNNNNNFL